MVDSFALSLIFFLFLGFGKLLTARAEAILDGRSVEEMKVLLMSSVEISKAFLSNLQLFIFLFVIGGILILTLTIMIISYSRSLVWSNLLHKKLKWKRWNGLTIVLILLMLLYIIAFAFIRIVLNLVPFTTNQNVYTIYAQVISSLFIIIFLLFTLIANYSFAQKQKVWESIGNTFHIIKTQWSKLWKTSLILITISVVLGILQFLLQKVLPLQLMPLLSIIILLLFIFWARIYLVKRIHHGHQQPHQK